MNKAVSLLGFLLIVVAATQADANLAVFVIAQDDDDSRGRFISSLEYELRQFGDQIAVGGHLQIGNYGDRDGGNYMAQCYIVALPTEVNPYAVSLVFVAVNKSRGYLNSNDEVVELLSVEDGNLVLNDAVAIFEQTSANYGAGISPPDLARRAAEIIVNNIASAGDL